MDFRGVRPALLREHAGSRTDFPCFRRNVFQRLACLHVRELGKRREKKVAWCVIATLFRGVGLPH